MIAKNDSKHNQIIKFPTGSLDVGDPLDTGHVRDGIINNLEQLYNGSGQLRLNVMNRTEIEYSLDDSPGLNFVTDFHFPLTVLKDGTTAPLFVEVCGAAVDTPGGSFFPRITCVLGYRDFGYFPTAGATSVGYAQMTSETLTWYPIINIGDSGEYLRVAPSAPTGVRAMQTRRHPDEIGRTADVSVVQAQLRMFVSLEEGTGSTGIIWIGITARESPWNNYA